MLNHEDFDLDNSLGMLLARASQNFNLALNREFTSAGHSTTVEQWKILLYLFDQDGVTQQQVSEKIYKNKASVARIIDALERRGLVSRHHDASDRRSNRIHLTSKGKQIQSRLVKLVLVNTEQIEANISRKEMTIFKKVLKQLISNIKDNLGSK